MSLIYMNPQKRNKIIAIVVVASLLFIIATISIATVNFIPRDIATNLSVSSGLMILSFAIYLKFSSGRHNVQIEQNSRSD